MRRLEARDRSLTSVDLWGDHIGTDGARTLAASLKGNQTLHSIDLANNEIGDIGVQALFEALRGNATLTSIDLRKNNIGRDGVRTLAEALRENKTLTTVYHDFSHEDFSVIETVVAQNKEKYIEDYPLHGAIKFSDGEERKTKVLELLSRGFSPAEVDNVGLTAWQTAQMSYDQGVIEILQKYLEQLQKRHAEYNPLYTCPITKDIMREPVMDHKGHNFEKTAIEQWIAENHNCPIGRESLKLSDLAPNLALRDLIGAFLAEHPELQSAEQANFSSP